MSKQPIWQWSAVETAAAVRKGNVSAVEVTKAHIARMKAANPAVNAVVVDLSAQALKAAQAADRATKNGGPTGPLHGVPITVKINVDVQGQANSNGVVAFKDNIAPDDSAVVRNLRQAGAIIIGMTNTPEFSLRGFTDNPLHGLTLIIRSPAAVHRAEQGRRPRSASAPSGMATILVDRCVGRRIATGWRRSAQRRVASRPSTRVRPAKGRCWRK